MQTQTQELNKYTNNFFKHIPHTTHNLHKSTALHKAMHSNYDMHSNLRDGLHNAIFANLRSSNLTIIHGSDGSDGSVIGGAGSADVQEEMYSRSDIILAVSIAMFFAFICSILCFYCVFKVRKWRLERSRAHRAENENS
jgi:hypothetical protein